MKNIFFSWQSDLDSKNHRNYIEKCIKKSIKSLNKEDVLHLYFEYDRDTLGLSGSPDITSSIFDKIKKCTLFIADISNITTHANRSIPNPNVLIELGYAINILGWERIICFFDINTGTIEQLPFDIRQKRILTYDPTKENEDKRIISIINNNIISLFSQGKLANPLVDYMKGKIDKCFLDVSKKICNLLFNTCSLSSGLADTSKLLTLTQNEIKEKLENAKFPAFVFLDTFDSTNILLREILKDLFSSNYFSQDWTLTTLNLIDWLRIHYNIVDPRDVHNFVTETTDNCSNKYCVISASSTNPANPPNSKLVFEVIYKENDEKKYVDPHHGKVINTLEYPNLPKTLEKIYTINSNRTEYLSNHIYYFIRLCNHWLDLTDSEFILDPDFYQIGKF